MNQKHFSIIGFQPDIASRLKEIISVGLVDDIRWLAAKHHLVETAIINADFISSPKVKAYLKNRDVNSVFICTDPSACFCNSLKSSSRSGDNGVVKIDLSNHDSKDISRLLTVFGKESAPSLKVRKDDVVEFDGSQSYVSLMNFIKAGKGFVVSVDSEGRRTWLDLDNQHVFINYEERDIPPIDTLSWEAVSHLKDIQSINNIHKVSLRSWLLESIWLSNIDTPFSDITRSKYRLTSWPRPINSSVRTKLFRMAAFCQYVAVTLEELENKTRYPAAEVGRFVYAMIFLNQMELVKSPQAALGQVSNQANINAMPANKHKLGVLSKLRAKLGIQ